VVLLGLTFGVIGAAVGARRAVTEGAGPASPHPAA
jgi:hypothetical protein